ncbi:Gfo/Idh/MocA family protein [Photobacterium alginatilyticum]|uniref:Gfo/Idh/MocA family oxidoreductase n=1 Tax=Photobacterium alginatilyticum TaxID=1775171 RepID=A0ABW9YLC1_9GAMM|nr:Gfo/Idh/MocA family oxidoreductase [Photobacterium alginatilyticum]NBI53869.1 gfo/Idh/MocA family oxidoreductase [Photobacterium alginatilyticum]
MNKYQDKTIRWGIIGCGNVTEVKSGPAYQQAEGFELVAVMRRDEAKARDYAARHGVKKYYTDADQLIADDEVDAVYIATPPDSHRYYAQKVAAAGKPCCIEKPLALSHEDCQAIVAAFEQQQLPLFVAYYRRSLPRFQQVKAWLEAGKIGDIRHVSWHLSKPANPLDLSGDYNWRTDATIAAGGYFDDLASHGLDLLIYLLGEVQHASGFAVNQQGLYSANDAVTGCWVHQNGITGSGSWNFGSAKREDRVEIIGSQGKIMFSVFDEAPVCLANQDGEQSRFIDNPKHIQQYHVAAIDRDLREQRCHPSTGKTATHTSWVMEQILGR